MADRSTIVLALALDDDRLAFAAATTVRSALEHLAPDDTVLVYLLIEEVTEACLSRLRRSWDDPRLTLVVVPAGDRLKPFFNTSRGTILRLMLGELLPPDVEKVLYLDVDTLVLRDLRPLWETDLGDHVLGCVPDPYARVSDFWHDKLSTAGRSIERPLGREHRYFNGGVLLIDLRRWRDLRVGQSTLSLLVANPGLFKMLDQDVLNLVLQGRVLYLQPIWNAIDSPALLWQWDTGMYGGLDPSEAVLNPAIRHFAGLAKPWGPYVRSSESRLYFGYLDLTDWRHWRPARSQTVPVCLLQSFMDFHWLTVRALWWPRRKATLRAWIKAVTRNPHWLILYGAYFLRLACLVLLYRPWKNRRNSRRSGTETV